MMRILALTNLYPSPWLPNRATFNRQQFAALARDHALHVIAPVPWTDQLRSRVRTTNGQLQIRDGIVVEHPRFLFTPGFFRHRHGDFYVRSVRSTFERVVTTFEPDVVLAAWAYPDVFAAAELCRRFNLPLVAKVHGSDVLLLDSNTPRYQQTRDALRAANAVITVSKHLASAVNDLGIAAERIHTVYNGVDTSLFTPRRSVAEPFTRVRKKLLFVGNLVEVKGIDTLIQACALLRDRGVDVDCDIVGTGPLRDRLDKLIRHSALQDRIRLCGGRSLAELPDVYRAADVFVLPSRSEGVPNVILEAIACGTPVVATRVGGIPEVVDETSVVEPNSPSALADAIQRQLATPMRSAIRTQSWNDSARDVARVLEQVVHTRRRVAA